MKDRRKPCLNVIGDLPGIPIVASKVMTAASDPASGADDLRKIIEHDPANRPFSRSAKKPRTPRISSPEPL